MVELTDADQSARLKTRVVELTVQETCDMGQIGTDANRVVHTMNTIGAFLESGSTAE